MNINGAVCRLVHQERLRFALVGSGPLQPEREPNTRPPTTRRPQPSAIRK